MYRKCKDVEGSVLLLIRDTMGVVFGAVMSETMKCSKHFYGTGETFVFHWKPTFKVSILYLILHSIIIIITLFIQYFICIFYDYVH